LLRLNNYSGRRLKHLDGTDQLNYRIVFAVVAKLQTVADQRLPPDKPAQLVQAAQHAIDASSSWRKPTLSNFANLFLLFLTLSIDGREEAQCYFNAAAAHFRLLFRHPHDLVGADGEHSWFAYRFALIDAQLALDSGNAPLL
jgi:hypothetical protein